MGICHSGEEEAKETELPMPEIGKAINVCVKKQGKRDADYDVLDMSNGEPGQVWMLIDTVGGTFSKSMKYYLKYRKDGEEESTVLGAAEMKSKDMEFKYKITDWDTEQEIDYDFDSDPDDFSDDEDDDFDMVLENEVKVKTKWKVCEECTLYSDKDMDQKLGKLKAKAKGKYKRKTTKTTRWVTDRNEEGNEYQREVTDVEVKHKTKLKKFYYKYEVNDTKIDLKVKKDSKGGSFSKAGLEWTGESETGAELFKIVGDGKKCHIKTSEGSNPNSTLLAAFACAIQLDPVRVEKHATGLCENSYLG